MKSKCKKPPKPSEPFADALVLTDIKIHNATHYVTFDGLITSNQYTMKLGEFDKIVAAGRYDKGMIRGEFFLNSQNHIRLYD